MAQRTGESRIEWRNNDLEVGCGIWRACDPPFQSEIPGLWNNKKSPKNSRGSSTPRRESSFRSIEKSRG